MYDLERKIRYELLAPSLQAKFTAMDTMFSKINTIVKEISENMSTKDKIKKIEDDITVLKTLYENTKSSLDDKFNETLSGAEVVNSDGTVNVPGIFFAYKNSKPKSTLKLNKDKKRLEGINIMHYAVIANGNVSNIQANSLPSDSIVYDTTNKKIYKVASGTLSAITNGSEEDINIRFKILTRNFVHDPITKKMYYFWSPTVYTRIR